MALKRKTAPIFAEPLFAAVGPHHPWAQLTEMCLAGLQHEALVLPRLSDGLLEALSLTRLGRVGLKNSWSGGPTSAASHRA
jgi:hypothetical protein